VGGKGGSLRRGHKFPYMAWNSRGERKDNDARALGRKTKKGGDRNLLDRGIGGPSWVKGTWPSVRGRKGLVGNPAHGDARKGRFLNTDLCLGINYYGSIMSWESLPTIEDGRKKGLAQVAERACENL